MPRMMSFSMTTRRFGWWFLRPGDRLVAVEKAMGLRKGETVRRIGLIEVVSTRGEPLGNITAEDCRKEGFPELSPTDFVAMLARKYGCSGADLVNRIEFRHLPAE